MTDLTDIQRRILQTATDREDGSVLPLPDDLKIKGGALNATLKSLAAKGLIDREADPPTITDAGRAAVLSENSTAPERSDGNPAAPIREGTKKAKVLSLLRRKRGASIEQLMEETGWQAHSVRATLTGLRKLDLEIVRKPDAQGASIYRIEG